MNISSVRDYIEQKLRKSLSPTLTYHGLHHTFDVVEACKKLAIKEGIKDEGSLLLLETAALYHDLGFISTYRGHEEEACRIAGLTLPKFGFSKDQIEKVSSMIMATKIPQSPKNHLEQIIADADLDYLGRDDFEEISNSLYQELLEREIVSDIKAWNRIQVDFLSSHKYWTKSANELRSHQKKARLKELEQIVNSYA
jgi:uncharacterized protein